MKLTFFTALVLLFIAKAQASLIEFDFGNNILETEITTQGSLSFTNAVANDGTTNIYAQIVAETHYQDGGAIPSGAVLGDIRINQKRNSTTTYSFTLYQDAALTQLYAPTTPYQFDLFFYDIDGHNKHGDKYYDEVRVYTPSVIEYTASTLLSIIHNTDGSITASGYGTPSVKGQNGLVVFNQQQADVAASFTFTNTSQVLFDYTIVNQHSNGNRNLLIDANDLSFSGFTTTRESITQVPEPASISLMVLSLGLLLMRSRKKAIKTN